MRAADSSSFFLGVRVGSRSEAPTVQDGQPAGRAGESERFMTSSLSKLYRGQSPRRSEVCSAIEMRSRSRGPCDLSQTLRCPCANFVTDLFAISFR